MEYALNWSERAITNLDSIEKYIAKDSPQSAKKIVNELLDYAEELKTFPLRGSKVLELYDMELRQLVKHSYRIVYAFEDNVVTVIAVIHVRQDIIAQFAKK